MKKLYYIFTLLCLLCIVFSVSALANDETYASRKDCILYITGNAKIPGGSTMDKKSAIDILEKYTDFDVQKYTTRDIEILGKSISENILIGFEDNTLRLNDNVTRAEFATMLYRAKEYYKATTILTYNNKYSDIPSWAEDAIEYCIENGFLMGYGDKFGSDDYITKNQISLLIDRLYNGLSIKEKYAFMYVCDQCPFPYDEVLNSVNNDEVCSIRHDYGDDHLGVDEDKPGIAKRLEELLETVGNMDYEKFADSNFVEKYRSPLTGTNMDHTNPPDHIIFEYENSNNENTNIDNLIAKAIENKEKRESICVISPESAYSGGIPSYGLRHGHGYEYFIYTQSNNLPDGIELNVWYKRRIDITMDVRRTHEKDYITITCSSPEIFCDLRKQ